MRKALIRKTCSPVGLGLLLAAIGFSYSMATTDGSKAAVIPPTCSLPEITVVSGEDSSTAQGIIHTFASNDLGSVVVNRTFTRVLNFRDGFPPYEFPQIFIPSTSDLSAVTDGKTVTLQGASGGGARLRSGDPGDQPPPAALDGFALPQFSFFDLRIEDNNPDPNLATGLVTFCLYVIPVTANGESDFGIIDATNVVLPTTINPGTSGNDIPTNVIGFTPTTQSDGTSFHDLPTGLQNQQYTYQFHANGGTRFGGEVTDGAFSPTDALLDNNFEGAITADTTSVYGGSAAGTYTFRSENVGGDATLLDLVLEFNGDDDELGLRGDNGRTIFDVMGNSVAGITTPLNLAVGTLGLRININQSIGSFIDGSFVFPVPHPGDQWNVVVTGLDDPIHKFALHPDSPDLPDGLSLETSGLLTGIPRRSNDFTFIINVQQLDPDNNDLILHESTRQFFLRIQAAPVSSQMVLAGGSFRLHFGSPKRDTIGFQVYLAKDVLRDIDQLTGASFDMIIGNDPLTRVQLSKLVGLGPPGGPGTPPAENPLKFGKGGQLRWPPQVVPGDSAGEFIQDARVLIKALNPDTGSMKILVSGLNLAEAVDAATAGLGTTIEAPINIQIKKDTGANPIDLTFDEIVTFSYRTSRTSGLGNVPRGPSAATLNIGQFMITQASGNIKFDPFSGGSDTLDMVMSGFIRHPSRAPIQSPLIDNNASVCLLLGALCAYEGTFSDFVQKGSSLILTQSAATVPLEQLVIDNATGTFSIKLRSPATNAATIQGLSTGLVIDANEPFIINVRLRILDDRGTATTLDDALYFDGQYSLTTFREGSKLGIK